MKRQTVWWTCRNPRCFAEETGRNVVLCPSCRLAGSYGVLLAALLGAILKWAGVL